MQSANVMISGHFFRAADTISRKKIDGSISAGPQSQASFTMCNTAKLRIMPGDKVTG